MKARRFFASTAALAVFVLALQGCGQLIGLGDFKDGTGGAGGAGGKATSTTTTGPTTSTGMGGATSTTTGASGSGGHGGMGGHGGGAGQCQKPSDCPVTGTECVLAVCTATKTCATTDATSGTALSQQTPGDCQKVVCDGKGGTTTEADDTDLPTLSNPCKKGTCSGGMTGSTDQPPGTMCSMGGIKCDGAGNCAACLSPADCPATGNPCIQATCLAAACGTSNVATGSQGTCAANHACNASQVCELVNGQACTMGSQCVSGDCSSGVDQFCCSAACAGPCSSCAGGTCAQLAVGVQGGCAANQACNAAGACEASNAVACTMDNQCVTGHCSTGADQFCCTTACIGACNACATGTCTQLPANSKGACPANEVCNAAGNCEEVNGQPCTLGSQCVSTICSSGADAFCCATACTSPCSSCASGSCAQLPSGNAGACGAGKVCNAAGVCEEAIGQPCSMGGQCASGFCSSGADQLCCASACAGACNSCSTGSCVQLGAGSKGGCDATHACNAAGVCEEIDGQACTMGAECVSGICSSGADQLCCSNACTGPCNTCATGTCAQVALGGKGGCTGTLVCNAAGTCEEPDGQACTLGSQCVSGICSSGADEYCCASTCIGLCNSCASGACTPVATGHQGGCAANQACNAAGSCELVTGQACTLGSQCLTGFCSTDDLCCATACAGPCNTCVGGTCGLLAAGAKGSCGANLACNAGGSCELVDGQACTLGSQCLTGFCSSGADKFCCAAACTGPCNSCASGACTQLAPGAAGACAAPTVCNGAGTCVASNDGAACTLSSNCADNFCFGGTCGATAISAGAVSTCALTASGGAQCFGYNGNGQLGNGTTTDSSVPVPVTGLSSGVASLATSKSGYHACALKSGAVECWGANSNGQLGNGQTMDSHVPVAVGFSFGDAAVPTAIAISAGGTHTCAVMLGGTVQCWGANSQGQLGNNSMIDSHTPVAVSGLAGFTITAVAAGLYHTCALTSGGAVLCWGLGGNGQLGNGSMNGSTTPVAVSGLSAVKAISSGDRTVCAVTTANALQCWGDDSSGQLGNGSTNGTQVPIPVSGFGSGVAAVSLGSDFTCALTTSGGVFCWGDNSVGQLGSNVPSPSLVPVAATGLSSGIASISGGGAHACALTTAGAVECWGDNNHGQLGNNMTVSSNVPVFVYEP